MKRKIVLSFALLILTFQYTLGRPSSFPKNIIVSYIDPLEKIMKEQSYFPDQPAFANVCKGEYASFQFVYRNPSATEGLNVSVSPVITERSRLIPKVYYEDYVKNGRNTPNPSRDRIPSPSGWYPDPIISAGKRDIAPLDNQPVWISLKIPEDTKPGLYKTNVVFSGNSDGKKFSIKKEISIKVYDIKIPEQKLWVTNWWFASSDKLKLLNGGKEVVKYSDLYWKIIGLFAEKMKEYRQNVVLISPMELTLFKKNGKEYNFDFSNFDKTVNIFLENGGMKRIEGGHFGGRLGGWKSNFGLQVPMFIGDSTYTKTLSIEDTVVKEFYGQFLPAFYMHLKEKGWDKIYVQHIADEPIEFNKESYKAMVNFVRSGLPKIPIIDADQTTGIAGNIDIWVPQLNFLKNDLSFYEQQIKEGKEVWFYTCLEPQGNYPNRFIELPLIETRLLHWINFKYGITGYLHWGYNYWGNDPYGDVSGIFEGCQVLPAGDTHIAYPGNMEINGSIRLEAMRDGIVDYELLRMLEEKKPEKAKEVVNSMVADFERFDCSIKSFREKRQWLLELLSQ
jgi:hypothetical protein